MDDDDFFKFLDVDENATQDKAARHHVATEFKPIDTQPLWFCAGDLKFLYSASKTGPQKAINRIEYFYYKKQYLDAYHACIEFQNAANRSGETLMKEISEIKARCIMRLDFLDDTVVRDALSQMTLYKAEVIGTAYLRAQLSARILKLDDAVTIIQGYLEQRRNDYYAFIQLSTCFDCCIKRRDDLCHVSIEAFEVLSYKCLDKAMNLLEVSLRGASTLMNEFKTLFNEREVIPIRARLDKYASQFKDCAISDKLDTYLSKSSIDWLAETLVIKHESEFDVNV